MAPRLAPRSVGLLSCYTYRQTTFDPGEPRHGHLPVLRSCAGLIGPRGNGWILVSGHGGSLWACIGVYTLFAGFFRLLLDSLGLTARVRPLIRPLPCSWIAGFL